MSLKLTEELKNIKQVDWREWFIESRIKRHITERRATEILSEINPVEGKIVLDLGCSFGYTSCTMAKKGARVFGVDVNEALLEIATKLADANRLKLNFIRANAKRLPFPNGTFDIVVCSELIEHIINWEKTIEEIARVVKRDGQAIISTPNINSLAIVKMLLVKYRLMYSRGYERFLPHKKIRKALEKNGLRVEKERKANFAFSYSPSCFYQLILWLENVSRPLENRWGGTIIFSCRKVGSVCEDLSRGRESLDKILVCPLCLGQLKEEKEALICPNCSKKYPIRRGIPIMVVDENEARDWADISQRSIFNARFI